ncbi:MAG: ATP-binding protein [Caulobacteraceae bacterium]
MSASSAPRHSNTAADRLALEAQSATLPQALILFGVSLPIFVWAGSFALNAAWMAASFAVFALNWGAFYAVVNWLKTEPSLDLARRLRVHVLCGLLWAGAVAQVAAFADGSGPARESLLLVSAAGCVICLFFAAPSLPSLLTVGPAAMAGPLIAAFSREESLRFGGMLWGAFALTFMLCLIHNRNLRRQFELTGERERLAEEKAASLETAERLAKSKSDLLATLSHEIRNGLTGVAHVLAAAAGQGSRAAPSREQLGAALAASNDLIAVLNATLDSESAEAGRLAIDAAPFDPAPMVREIVLGLRPQAAAKGLELAVFVDPVLDGRQSGAVLADAARTRQVLGAIIGNAVRYTVRGRIEARLELADPRRLRITVADTGPGLAADELDLAFQPFRRVERTAAGVPGAGLGLSLSRQLVDLMGAQLTVESAVGVGSAFVLDMPFDPNALYEPEAFDEAMPEAAGLRVLLSEEEPLTAAMLRQVFEQLGHRVVLAASGTRAIELAQVVDFDLALVGDPGSDLDAPALIRALRGLSGPRGNLPIIAATGGDAEQSQDRLNAGANTVLRKPVSVSLAARAVADATSGPAPIRLRVAS